MSLQINQVRILYECLPPTSLVSTMRMQFHCRVLCAFQVTHTVLQVCKVEPPDTHLCRFTPSGTYLVSIALVPPQRPDMLSKCEHNDCLLPRSQCGAMACRLLLVLFPESWLCTGTRPQIAAFMGSHLLVGHPQTQDHLTGAHLRLMCCLASGNTDVAHVSLLLLRSPKPCYSLCLCHLHCSPSAAQL